MKLSSAFRKPVLWLGLITISSFAPALHSASVTTSEAVASVQADDTAYQAELEKAIALLRRQKYDDALKSFKRANEMMGKKSRECYFGMAQAYYGLKAFKDAVESCDKAMQLAVGDDAFRAQTLNLKGLALQAQSELKNDDKLIAAETAFREGLALNKNMHTLSFNLGVVLVQLKRDQEGIAELKKYVTVAPNGDFAEQARKIIENPRRAREAYAPDFSIVTSDGRHITLEDLRGKVVVLDFWGTWCAPCVESVPSLRNLNKHYSKEPSFVLIGVSSDTEEELWREFTSKNKMIWPQYWDRDRQIQRMFNVRAFPTYIVIDHEGIVRFRASGTSWERSGDLSAAIKKHVKIVAKAGSELP